MQSLSIASSAKTLAHARYYHLSLDVRYPVAFIAPADQFQLALHHFGSPFSSGFSVTPAALLQCFSRARHERFRESDALRRLVEGVVTMCIAAGLVVGEAFSLDASLISQLPGRRQNRNPMRLATGGSI